MYMFIHHECRTYKPTARLTDRLQIYRTIKTNIKRRKNNKKNTIRKKTDWQRLYDMAWARSFSSEKTSLDAYHVLQHIFAQLVEWGLTCFRLCQARNLICGKLVEWHGTCQAVSTRLMNLNYTRHVDKTRLCKTRDSPCHYTTCLYSVLPVVALIKSDQ